MASEQDGVKSAINENTKQVRRLAERVVDSSLASVADVLTDQEVELLAKLASHREDLQDFCSSLCESDPNAAGVLEQFADMNLISCTTYISGSVSWESVSKKAEWFVERRAQRKAEAEARAKELRRQRAFGYAVSLFSALLGVVVGWVLGRL